MKKTDFILDHIVKKDFIEDLMKAFGWVTLCGAIFSLSLSTIKAGSVLVGLLVFGLFLLLSTLSLVYVCLYLFIPLDNSMYADDPYWDEESKKLSGVKRLTAIIKVIIAKNKILYITASLGFFFYGKLVADFLAASLGT